MSTEQEIRDTLADLPDETARDLLAKMSSALTEIDQLKEERREKVGKVTGQIAALRGTIESTMDNGLNGENKLSPGDALVLIDKSWTKMVKLEAKRDSLRKEYGDKIKAAEAAARKVLDNLRQPELPFEGTQAEAPF